MVERSEVARIKCGQIFLLSDDNFTLICEYCERDFYTLVDFRSHLREHLPELHFNIEDSVPSEIKEEFVDHPDDAGPLSKAAACLPLTGITESSNEAFQNEQKEVNQLNEKLYLQSNSENENESGGSDQTINMYEANQQGTISASDLKEIESFLQSIPREHSAYPINACFHRDNYDIHTGKRAYECHICFKTFHDCTDLSNHFWNVHKLRILCKQQ